MTHPCNKAPGYGSEDEQKSIKLSVRDTNLTKSDSPRIWSTQSSVRSDQCGTLKNPHPQHHSHTEDEETRPATPQGDTLHGEGMDERQYQR